MLENTHSQLYFSRMQSSLGDKTRMIDYLRAGTVMDFGAGGGDLSEYVRMHGYDVLAVDGSEKAIQRTRETYPHVKTMRAMSDEILDVFPDRVLTIFLRALFFMRFFRMETITMRHLIYLLYNRLFRIFVMS